MPKHIRNRLILIAVLTAAAVYFALPTLTKDQAGGWRKILPRDGMRLGLDLQGGMHLILKVNLARAVQNHLELSITDLRQALREKQVAIGRPEAIGTNRMRLPITDPSAVPTVKQVLKEGFPYLELSVENAGYLEVRLKEKELADIEENAVTQSLEIIRNRIDQFGVAEPVIVRQGKDEIVLQLPGIKDPERAIELVGRTAQLQFKLVDPDPAPELSTRLEAAVRSGRLKNNFSHRDLNEALREVIPAGDEVYLEKRVDRESGTIKTMPVLVKQATLMTGEAIRTARMEIGGRYNEPYVALTFNDRGARLFEKITAENVGRQLAIILDDIVQSAPVIQERIAGGKAQITGNFTPQEANDLAIVLRAGALPAPVDIVQNLTVGPSLGRDSIRNGIASAILGTILVAAFMVIYYRLSGVIANAALLLNLVLMLAALSLFRATLTLPGIAGIVLSIGMAVDSNVLIFERMREEIALDRPIRSSVEAGYDKALWTIIDSHVTTLITALALFLFGTGPIKGFAVTLSIGVLFNLFTALYGTRVVYDYLNFKRRIKSLRFLHLIGHTRIDFIRLRNFAFLFSGALVILGLTAFVQIERGKGNLGVDFAGGTMVQFKADKAFALDAVRSALSRHHLTDYELQDVPREHILMVRTKTSQESVGTVADRIAKILAEDLPDQHFVMESKAEIGASVSRDLKRAALTAIAISLAGIVLYLAWRFDRRFGVAAAVATFHDVLTVLGIFYLLDKEITLLVVTALLTLAGYSLTDTVVVFDRIRENLHKKGRQDLKDVINRSINEVLSRTIITSGTVFLVLMALLLTGGVLLRDFALALLIGVVVGTYSSIFVASPIVYIWPTSGKKRREAGNRGQH
ncbi:MAG: protein translocase subunit SecD [Desulfobacterales bacterium]